MDYFNEYQLFTLITGLLLFAISLYFHLREKRILSLIFLLLSALSLFSFAALLDPFLNLYDERFHALVAKNMVNHPFRPTLYDDPVLDMSYDTWDKFHIWLHKQPLFLWQIALSFKLFGISEFTLRIPSLLLSVTLVAIGYRTGKLLDNERTGFITGILIVSSLYHIQLVAGRRMLEHNDVSFMVYVSLSIWSLVEYHYSGKRYWIILIGLFSGLAILCKWLVGLLVYSGWFVLKINKKNFNLSNWKDVLISMGVTIAVALPWQVYTFITYPIDASLAQDYNFQHIFLPLDGHSGSYWYHFQKIDTLFGSFTAFLIIPSYFILYKKLKDKRLFISMLTMLVITFAFFSLVQTKMPAFTIITTLLIFIPLAALLSSGLSYVEKMKTREWVKKVVTGIVILLIFFIRFDMNAIFDQHTLRNEENKHSRMLIHNKSVFKSLTIPDSAVIFNVKGQHYIECMFYTGLPAYRIVPDYGQYIDLKKKGRVVAIFKPQAGKLPEYILSDSTAIILDYTLQGYN